MQVVKPGKGKDIATHAENGDTSKGTRNARRAKEMGIHLDMEKEKVRTSHHGEGMVKDGVNKFANSLQMENAEWGTSASSHIR